MKITKKQKLEIENAIKKYSQDNWGGEQEQGLSEETIENVRMFFKIVDSKLVDISATNDGQLSLECKNKDLFVVRINKFGVIFEKI